MERIKLVKLVCVERFVGGEHGRERLAGSVLRNSIINWNIFVRKLYFGLIQIVDPRQNPLKIVHFVVKPETLHRVGNMGAGHTGQSVPYFPRARHFNRILHDMTTGDYF